MVFLPPSRILIRGGGEMGSGTAWRLHRAGYRVIIAETDIPTATQFIEPLLESTREQIFSMPDLADNKSHLQEWIQGHKLGMLAYALIEARGPDHSRTFEVEVRVNGKALGRGLGSSKAAAEQEAAKAALGALGIE